MRLRSELLDWSKGDRLRFFWRLYALHSRANGKLLRDILRFLLHRIARRHGGYVGVGAVFGGVPSLPHGLHGVFISRHAVIGAGCRIYQNVTVGATKQGAPSIGESCLLGAGAVIVGGIRIGDNVKIGAGTVVNCDVPSGCTVVAQPPRILERGNAVCPQAELG